MALRWIRNMVCIVILLIAMPSFASAHANLERSAPLQNAELKESPLEIRIKFTEEFDPKLSQIILENDKGESIKGTLRTESSNQMVYQIPMLANGVYKVKWQVLSVDTHVTEGSFRFSVAVPLAKDKPSETISLDGPPAAGAVSTPQPTQQPTTKPIPEKTTTSPDPSPTLAPKPETGQQDVIVSVKPAVASTPQVRPGETANSVVELSPRSTPPSNSQDGGEAAGFDAKLSAIPERSAEAINDGKPSPSPENREDIPRTGNDSIKPITQEVSATVEEGHDHEHSHPAGDGDWRNSAYHILRIVEVIMSVSIAGFLFFRYVLWDRNRADFPFLFSKRVERWGLGIAIMGLSAAGALHVWILADQLNEFGTSSTGELFMTILSTTMIGKASWLKPALAVLMFVMTFASDRDQRWAGILQAAAALALLVLFPLTGHAYGDSAGVAAAVFSHTLHMAAAAVWFGGLIGILTLTRNRDSSLPSLLETDLLIRRFSFIALIVIIIVAISGVVLAMMRLESWSALFKSEYGQLVLVKTAILLLIVVIGAFHRLVFIPKLIMAAKASPDPEEPIRRRFMLGVRIEVILALCAFIAAGMLSTTMPPEKKPGLEPIYWHVMGDKAHMSFRINDDSKGQAFRLDVWLPTGMGAPKSVNVQASQTIGGGSPVVIPFDYKSGGPDPYGYDGFDKYMYESAGDYLSATGEWKVGIAIQDLAGQVHTYEKIISIP